MPPSAAERFYSRSHERSAQDMLNLDEGPSGVVLNEIGQPSHRYFCAAHYLKVNGGGQSVVELGFGSARVARVLSQFVGNYRIVDVVSRHEGADLPGNVSFTQADLNDDFPFRNGEFDCTIAMMIVEHLFDPFHSISEIARITKIGGMIFLNLPNIASIRCRLELALGRMPVTSNPNWFENREWDGNHLHYFTVSDTLRLAALSRLKLEGIYPVGKMLWLKRASPALFCHEISFAFSRID